MKASVMLEKHHLNSREKPIHEHRPGNDRDEKLADQNIRTATINVTKA